jgi:hypothetical protein
MKQILTAALLTLGLAATVPQQAQAWSKFNFGVGLNLGWQGGGNSAFWGLVKGSPMPGTGEFGGDGDMPPANAYPSDAPQPMPSAPEKLVTPPTPVKPASFQYRSSQAPAAPQEQAEENYYPSYWYSGR